MYLSGFADEAADGIAGQIAATKALGWDMLEARSIDGRNIHDIPEREFDETRMALEEGGVRVSCFGSTIANWGKSLDMDHRETMATVARCVKRMKSLGVRYVRIMSYAIFYCGGSRACADQREKERFSRLREICLDFLDAGMVPLHENCLNYGGMSWEHTIRLLDAVPGLRVVYDTGNPGITPDFRKEPPYPNQDPWEAYRMLRPYIEYVHVKDGYRDPATGGETYFFPGEGTCQVERVLADLVATGYPGIYSIEPHMAVVFHDASVHSTDDARFDNYVEYGRRTEALLENLGAVRENRVKLS